MRITLLILGSMVGFCTASFAQQACNDRVNQSTPTTRFTDHGNGTVTDNRTGLMWQRCMMGYTFSNNGTLSNLADDTCTPTATTTFIWQLALQGAVDRNTQGGFGGFADWRVPNIKELISIVEHRCFNPAINLTIFPGTPEAAEVFSASPANENAGKTTVLFVAMADGADDSTFNAVIQTAAKSIRLVRAP